MNIGYTTLHERIKTIARQYRVDIDSLKRGELTPTVVNAYNNNTALHSNFTPLQLETINAILECNGDMAAIQKALNVNNNTMRNRLQSVAKSMKLANTTSVEKLYPALLNAFPIVMKYINTSQSLKTSN